MTKDRVVIGSIAGIIGSLCKDLPNFILYKMGVVKFLYAHLAASAQIDQREVYSAAGWMMGFLADMITGGAIGVVAIRFLDRFGSDYWWFKGCIIGNTIWLFGLGVILNLGAVNLIPNDPVFRFTSLFDHLLFGLVMVYLIHKWDRLTVENRKTGKEKR